MKNPGTHAILEFAELLPIVGDAAATAESWLYQSEGNQEAADSLADSVGSNASLDLGLLPLFSGVRIGAASIDRSVEGQVSSDATDLSRLVSASRDELTDPLSGKNGAVVEWRDPDGAYHLTEVTWSIAGLGSNGHSERLIGSALEKAGVDFNSVTRIYSEFEPCSTPTVAAGCGTYIRAKFPNAKVTYTWEYGDDESRTAGRAAKGKELGDRYTF